jgi:MarR family 2-MHQ and catechol resistance regulon transcriptional repressor
MIRAAETVTARTSRKMSAAGLTLSQFGVLEALLHKGSLCQRDIAAKILKSTGNITMVIDNLEKRGLVTRERINDDRRYLTIKLTEPGEELISATYREVEAAIVTEMGVLRTEEQETLGKLCKKLGLQTKGEIS